MTPPLPPCIGGGADATPSGTGSSGFREPESEGVVWGERHLQCIWADPKLRPALCTVGGAPVDVIDPGTWNGGPGPDFRDATISIGGVRRVGDVEIHVRPGDWEAHGHSADPAYASVVLHVAWFPPRPGVPVPDVPLAILRDAMLERGGFSFDQIDPSAYPWSRGEAEARPCSGALAGAPPERIRAVLESAGRARAARKAAEIANRAALAESPDQAFYEEILAALGWRANEGPMRRLARCVPVSVLSALPSPRERYATLLGRAGLLPQEPSRSAPAEWLSALWDAAFRAGAVSAPDETGRWFLGATRPANHPRVRLAAAAAMFAGPDALRRALFAIPREDPRAWAAEAVRALVDAAAPGAALLPPSPRPLRPLGAARATAILVNAVVPALVAEDPEAVRLLDGVKAEDLGAEMKETARRLLGPDHNPAALYSGSALRTQGLLELWRGRCRAAPAACAACPLAAK